jgi:hypothetical protein
MPDRRAPYRVTLGTAVGGIWPLYPLENRQVQRDGIDTTD